MTYYIEDLKPGMSESFTKTVTERDIELFGEVSGDVNPVHFDEAFASKTIFKGRIAHGVLSASYISTVLGMKMPGPGTIFMSPHHALQGAGAYRRHCGRDLHRARSECREAPRRVRLRLQGRRDGRRRRRSDGDGARATQGLKPTHEDLPPLSLTCRTPRRAQWWRIGNFDGVHLGPQALIGAARGSRDANGAPLGVVAFEPHPQEFFRPSPANRSV